jgi:hypothetical protein
MRGRSMALLVALFLTSLITVPRGAGRHGALPVHAVHPGRVRQRRSSRPGTCRDETQAAQWTYCLLLQHTRRHHHHPQWPNRRAGSRRRGWPVRRRCQGRGCRRRHRAGGPAGRTRAGHGLPARRPGCGESAEPGPPTGLHRLDAAHDRGFHVSGSGLLHRSRALTTDGRGAGERARRGPRAATRLSRSDWSALGHRHHRQGTPRHWTGLC